MINVYESICKLHSAINAHNVICITASRISIVLVLPVTW